MAATATYEPTPEIAAYIKRIVDVAPPLSTETRDQLAALIKAGK